jgi:lipoate-protein ligase A
MSDKGTVSAAKRVDPLRKQTGLSRAAISERMEETFVRLTGATRGDLRPEELAEAEHLVETKFSTREWLERVP